MVCYRVVDAVKLRIKIFQWLKFHQSSSTNQILIVSCWLVVVTNSVVVDGSKIVDAKIWEWKYINDWNFTNIQLHLDCLLI